MPRSMIQLLAVYLLKGVSPEPSKVETIPRLSWKTKGKRLAEYLETIQSGNPQWLRGYTSMEVCKHRRLDSASVPSEIICLCALSQESTGTTAFQSHGDVSDIPPSKCYTRVNKVNRPSSICGALLRRISGRSSNNP